MGNLDIRDGHDPLKAHAPAAVLPPGIQELAGRCLGLLGTGTAGGTVQCDLPGGVGAASTAGKPGGEGA